MAKPVNSAKALRLGDVTVAKTILAQLGCYELGQIKHPKKWLDYSHQIKTYVNHLRAKF
jgi:hypothetical protein